MWPEPRIVFCAPSGAVIAGKKDEIMTTVDKFAFIAVALLLPFPIQAGGYGEAGVRDATVGQMPAETAAVWCPKLRTEVPIELQRQLDCEDGVAVGTARPAVAPARFSRGLFGLPPHQPIGGSSALEGDGAPPVVPTTATDTRDTNDTPETVTTAGPKSKWERLGELGITPENLRDQDKRTREAIANFVKSPTDAPDWSSFNP